MCRKRLSSPICRSELIDSAWVVIVPGHKCIKNVVKEVLENVLASVPEQQNEQQQNELISYVPLLSSPVENHSSTISYKKLVDNLDLPSESGNSGVKTKDDKCMRENESICKDYRFM